MAYIIAAPENGDNMFHFWWAGARGDSNWVSRWAWNIRSAHVYNRKSSAIRALKAARRVYSDAALYASETPWIQSSLKRVDV